LSNCTTGGFSRRDKLHEVSLKPVDYPKTFFTLNAKVKLLRGRAGVSRGIYVAPRDNKSLPPTLGPDTIKKKKSQRFQDFFAINPRDTRQ
jgi:hypothetical protein